MMTEPHQFPEITLNVRRLTCERGGRRVLSGLDLEMASGRALFLKGPNGAGKSTLLLALAGLIHSGGQVHWQSGGAGIAPMAPYLHFCGHQHAVKPELTLAENLEFWADVLGGERGLIGGALESAGLGGLDRYAARNLSAGQAHRLALCRLLVAPRPVWLLDEPSSALDAAGDRWVAGLIDAQLKRNGLVIAATHRLIGVAGRNRTQVLERGAEA